MNCIFAPDTPGVFRCVNGGCGNAVRAANAELVGRARCKSLIVKEKLARKGVVDCIHRGKPIGEAVTSCGCGVPTWEKRYHACALFGKTLLVHQARRPGIRSCEKCPDRPTLSE